MSGRRFPAIKLDAHQIEAHLAARLAEYTITSIGLSADEVRSGYTGAVFISGRTLSSAARRNGVLK